MPSVLITGASRGLGLEFATRYAAARWRVEAACRDPAGAAELQRLAARHPDSVAIHPLDVSRTASIEALARQLAGRELDVLINNAGIAGRQADRLRLDPAIWSEALLVNTIAPVLVAHALLENLERGQRRLIVNISSRMGSIAGNSAGGYYPYRSSKAGLNAAMKSLSVDLAGRGMVVVMLHPGWVRTEMGGPNAPLTVAESVSDMISLIGRLTPADNGRFLDHDGSAIPW